MCDGVNILSPVIYFGIIINLGNKLYNQMSTDTLTLNCLGRAHEVFMTELFSSNTLGLYN